MTEEQFLKKYLTDRRGTDCNKWDAELEDKFGTRDVISMWIADMDFRTPDAIVEALTDKIREGVYGYSDVPKTYYQALSCWMESRYGVEIPSESVRFCTGCVTAIAWLLQAFTDPGDHCMILTPVYYPFHNVITYNGRALETAELCCDQQNYFTMDYEGIEKKIVDNHVKLLLFCSPHNPVGRVWSEEELDRLFSICQRHDVLIVSDEIHQDFCLFGHKFIPAFAVSNGKYQEHIICLNAASKTFNLAGLVHSHIIILDEDLRAKYDRFARGMNRNATNIMGQLATMTGYRYGEEWLKALSAVIEKNYIYLRDTLKAKVPNVVTTPLEGTYLAFLDLRAYLPVDRVHDVILKKCKIAVDYGEQFGENYKGFIRLNLATDPDLVCQAANRIAISLKSERN